MPVKIYKTVFTKRVHSGEHHQAKTTQ